MLGGYLILIDGNQSIGRRKNVGRFLQTRFTVTLFNLFAASEELRCMREEIERQRETVDVEMSRLRLELDCSRRAHTVEVRELRQALEEQEEQLRDVKKA